MALCNVLQFFVSTGDKRLSSIIVKGERIFQPDEGNSREEDWRRISGKREHAGVFSGRKSFSFFLHLPSLFLEVE